MQFSIPIGSETNCGCENGGSGGGELCKLALVLSFSSSLTIRKFINCWTPPPPKKEHKLKTLTTEAF